MWHHGVGRVARLALTGMVLSVVVLSNSAGGQVIGALDFEIRSSLDGAFSDVAVGPEGRVYLLEARGDAVTVFSPDLKRSLAVYELRTAVSRLGKAVALCAAADGSFWVADDGGLLAHIDPLGLPLGEFKFPGKGSVTLQRPKALAMAPDGALIIVDGSRKAVIIMETDGRVRTYIRGADARGVTFDEPIDVAVDRTGYLHVVDGRGGGVCKIDPWGVLRHRWPASADGPAPLRQPRCVSCDDEGISYVGDAAGRCAVMADTSVVAMFGTSGRLPGQLQNPVAVAATLDGGVVVVDADPPRVQIFGLPALDDVRHTMGPEDPFVAVKSASAGGWPWGGLRLDASNGALVVLGADRRSLAVGGRTAGRDGLQPVEAVAGRLKAASDVAFSGDGRLVIADEGARAVLVVDPDAGTVDEVPCPLGAWKSPTRVAEGFDDAMVVWDKGHKAVALVLGEEARHIPVTPKGEVVDLVATERGDIVLFTNVAQPMRIGPSGPLDPGMLPPFQGLTAAARHESGIVAALEGGGFVGTTWSGEQLFVGGISAGVPPGAMQVVDVAADANVLVMIAADGSIVSYTVENAGRAVLSGEIISDRRSSFTLRIEAASEGGRTTEATVATGVFEVGNLLPGMYRWQIGAPGWLTVSGESTIWLKTLRVADLGSVTLRPAGDARGMIEPPGLQAAVTAMQHGEAVATVPCDASGRYELRGLPPGDYDLTVEAVGFKPRFGDISFTVEAGVTTDVPTAAMLQLGSIKGYVKPMAVDQEVWILRERRLVRICRPEPLDDLPEEAGDLLGRFECTDLEPGVYAALLRTRGFYPDTTLAPIVVEEGQAARCGTAILIPAVAESAAIGATAELGRAYEEYGQARFSVAQERIERMLAGRQLPYAALGRAYQLLGRCAVARGAAFTTTARGAFRAALLLDPGLTPDPDASPTVRSVMEAVRAELFGESGPPSDVFM